MNDRATISVVVVDDHEMILQSVVRLLAADPQIVVVGRALTGAEGIEITMRVKPDVLVIDFHLPDMDAPEAIRQLREANSDVKVVTISGSEQPDELYASVEAGSSAWVRKTRAIHELRDAICHVAAGSPFVQDEMQAIPKKDELVVHFQPIVSLDGGRIVGFEALVRWQHPERGLLYPASFLPYAQATGDIKEIDQWIRQKAVQQLAIWQHECPMSPPLWMSVNLSPTDILDQSLYQSLADILKESEVDPSHLVVEIAESVLLDDSENVLSFLTKLNSLGVKLALDDFGTAFSSISYVRRFPFDQLKLDSSFTAEMPHSVRSMLLVEEICNMAHSLKVVGIAVGIERPEQLDSLRDIGFELGQGYLFSAGASADECSELLSKMNLMPSLEHND